MIWIAHLAMSGNGYQLPLWPKAYFKVAGGLLSYLNGQKPLLLQHPHALADGKPSAGPLLMGAREDGPRHIEIAAAIEHQLRPATRRGSISRPCRSCGGRHRSGRRSLGPMVHEMRAPTAFTKPTDRGSLCRAVNIAEHDPSTVDRLRRLP